MTANDNNNTLSARWWEESSGEAHRSLIPTFRVIREESEWRLDADDFHAGLYCASDRPGVRNVSTRDSLYECTKMPYNLCRQSVDTLLSKIAQQRPLPEVLTQKGNWSQQKRARKQTQFIEGEFSRQRIFEKKAPQIVRDALVYGRAYLKIWSEGRRIKTQRAYPFECFTDVWDARYGEPRNFYQVWSMDQGRALEQFARTEAGGWKPKIKDAIIHAGRFDLHDETRIDVSSTVRRVDIIEAWHLCDRPEAHLQAEDEGDDLHDEGSPDADDKDDKDEPTHAPRDIGSQPRKHKCTGRHVVASSAGTLIDEPWEYDYFPFVELTYNPALTGVGGGGLVEQLEGYQYEINYATERLHEQLRLSGVHVFIPDGAAIQDQEMRNGINVTRHAAGGIPQIMEMDLVNEHIAARPRTLTEDGLNDAGLSQLSVQSQKPAGVDSGIALQTLDDVETVRFMMFGRAYEAWSVEVGRRLIDCAKQIAAAYGDYAVTVPMKGGILPIRWTDVYLEGVELRVFPASLLPQQLPERLNTLTMLFQNQIIDRQRFMTLLEAPDLQAELDDVTAGQLVIDEVIERMLDAEKDDGDSAYLAPSAYQDLSWASERAQQRYNRAWLDGAPEYNLDMVRRYQQQCEKLIAKMTPPAPQPSAAPALGAPPPAAAPIPLSPAPGPTLQ